LEEKMKLDAAKTERLMDYLDWTPHQFAEAIDIDITEAYKLLGGEAVNYYTAKRFIDYFKAATAAALIDFAATGIEPPAFLGDSPTDEDTLFAKIAKTITEKSKEKKAA
jgi:hypothetical protein